MDQSNSQPITQNAQPVTQQPEPVQTPNVQANDASQQTSQASVQPVQDTQQQEQLQLAPQTQSVSPDSIGVSGPMKERAPINQPAIQDIVKPTEQEPELSPEVKEAGVTTVPNPEHVAVKPEVKAVGVEPVKTAVPVQVNTVSDTIKLPMDENEAKKIMKTHPIVDSVRWIAMIVVEQAKKMHQSIVK